MCHVIFLAGNIDHDINGRCPYENPLVFLGLLRDTILKEVIVKKIRPFARGPTIAFTFRLVVILIQVKTLINSNF